MMIYILNKYPPKWKISLIIIYRFNLKKKKTKNINAWSKSILIFYEIWVIGISNYLYNILLLYYNYSW